MDVKVTGMQEYPYYPAGSSAEAAWNRGLRPASKVRAKDLRDAGISMPVRLFREMELEGFFTPELTISFTRSKKGVERVIVYSFYNLESVAARLASISDSFLLHPDRKYILKWKELVPPSGLGGWVHRKFPDNKPLIHEEEVTLEYGGWARLPNGRQKDIKGKHILGLTPIVG